MFRILQSKAKVFFDRCIDLTAWVASVGIAFIMVTVGLEVIFRYLTGHAHLWVLEFSEYSLLIVTLIGSAWVLRRQEHVKVDWLLIRLRPKQRVMFEVVINLLGAMICMVIAWYGSLICLDDFQSGAVFNKVIIVPRAPIISVIPIGCFLLGIQSLRLCYLNLGKWREFSRGQ